VIRRTCSRCGGLESKARRDTSVEYVCQRCRSEAAAKPRRCACGAPEAQPRRSDSPPTYTCAGCRFDRLVDLGGDWRRGASVGMRTEPTLKGWVILWAVSLATMGRHVL